MLKEKRKPYENIIKESLSDGDVDSALKNLKKYLQGGKSDYLKEFILIKGNYKKICREYRQQVITRDVYRAETNQLINNILSLIKEAKFCQHSVGEEEIKILLLAANPFGTKQLRLNEEIRKIKTNIKLAKNRDRLAFKSASAVTPENLMQEMLDERPYYVQFSGHGDVDRIYLEQDNGKPHFVDTDALEALFERL